MLGEGQPFENTAKPSFDVRYSIKSRSSGLSCKTTRLKTQSTSGCILPRTTKSSSTDKWQLRSWIKGGICLFPKEKHSRIGGTVHFGPCAPPSSLTWGKGDLRPIFILSKILGHFRCFYDTVEEEMERARRSGTPIPYISHAGNSVY